MRLILTDRIFLTKVSLYIIKKVHMSKTILFISVFFACFLFGNSPIIHISPMIEEVEAVEDEAPAVRPLREMADENLQNALETA